MIKPAKYYKPRQNQMVGIKASLHMAIKKWLFGYLDELIWATVVLLFVFLFTSNQIRQTGRNELSMATLLISPVIWLIGFIALRRLRTNLKPYRFSFIGFVVSAGIYLTMNLVQGFKWEGLFVKHTGISPHLVLFISAFFGFVFYTTTHQSKLFPKHYGYLVMVCKKLAIFFAPLYILMNLADIPSFSQWIVDHLRFHWIRLTQAMGVVTLFLISVILLDLWLRNKKIITKDLFPKKNTRKILLGAQIRNFRFRLGSREIPFVSITTWGLLGLVIITSLNQQDLPGLIMSFLLMLTIFMAVKGFITEDL